MSRSAWIWVGVLVVLLLLFWWWHRRHRKPVAAPQSIGTPLQSPAAAPPPTSIFSKLSADASSASSVFGGFASIFSGANKAVTQGGV